MNKGQGAAEGALRGASGNLLQSRSAKPIINITQRHRLTDEQTRRQLYLPCSKYKHVCCAARHHTVSSRLSCTPPAGRRLTMPPVQSAPVIEKKNNTQISSLLLLDGKLTQTPAGNSRCIYAVQRNSVGNDALRSWTKRKSTPDCLEYACLSVTLVCWPQMQPQVWSLRGLLYYVNG